MLSQVVSREGSSCQTNRTARERRLRDHFGRRTSSGAMRRYRSSIVASSIHRRGAENVVSGAEKKFRARERRCAARAPTKLTPQNHGLECSSLPEVLRAWGNARDVARELGERFTNSGDRG